MKPLRRSPLVQSPGLRGCEVAPGAGEVVMSSELVLALRLGASAAGCDEAEFVRRAIAEKAARIGLSGLLQESERGVAVAVSDAGLGSLLAARRAEESVASHSRACLNGDGDLIDLPDTWRRGASRCDDRMGIG